MSSLALRSSSGNTCRGASTKTLEAVSGDCADAPAAAAAKAAMSVTVRRIFIGRYFSSGSFSWCPAVFLEEIFVGGFGLLFSHGSAFLTGPMRGRSPCRDRLSRCRCVFRRILLRRARLPPVGRRPWARQKRISRHQVYASHVDTLALHRMVEHIDEVA